MSQDLTGSDRSARVGTVYRRNVRVCTTCDQRLDTTAARRACEGVGHRIEVRAQRIWWIKYYADGGCAGSLAKLRVHKRLPSNACRGCPLYVQRYVHAQCYRGACCLPVR
jgi:hypothetical protein